MCLSLSTLIRDCEDRNVVFRWSTEMIYPWHHRLGPSACAVSSVNRCACHILRICPDFSLLLGLIIGKVKVVAQDANAFIETFKVTESWRKAWGGFFVWNLWCLGNGKAITLQAWTGPEGSRMLRLQDIITTQDGGKIVSPTHRPPLPPRIYSWHSFLLEAELTPGHMDLSVSTRKIPVTDATGY